MDLVAKVNDIFQHSIQSKQQALITLPTAVAKAANMMTTCLQANHKILSCGNGGSAGDAQHFASELVNRFYQDRPHLPAIALTADPLIITAIANDHCYTEVFARQLQALAQPGDILLAFTTSGNSANILKAVETAHRLNIQVIAVTGKDGGKLAPLLTDNDLELRVPSNSTARIQETHLLITHSLCEIIDAVMFGV